MSDLSFEWEKGARIGDHPYQQCASLHTTVRMASFCGIGDSPEVRKAADELKLLLEAVPGVVYVFLHPYRVDVIRGRLFNWETICPKMERVLQAWANQQEKAPA